MTSGSTHAVALSNTRPNTLPALWNPLECPDVAIRHRKEAVQAHHGHVLSTDCAGCVGGDHGLTSGGDSDVAVEPTHYPTHSTCLLSAVYQYTG